MKRSHPVEPPVLAPPASAAADPITHRPATALPPPAPVSVRQKLSRGRLARDRYLLGTQLVNLLSGLLGCDRVSGRLRIALLRRYGWEIGPGTQIDNLRYAYGTVRIGAGVYINRDCHLEGEAPITIGDGAGIGPGVMFITVGHAIGPSARRVGEYAIQPITVGAGAWIGARVTILPGVVIGPGAIVAAGSVVVNDVPADTLVAGVPAQVKRALD